jgi:hypothetical protein
MGISELWGLSRKMLDEAGEDRVNASNTNSQFKYTVN